MRLLLDECIGQRSLRDALTAAGHDVIRSIDVVGGGADDEAVFALACREARVLATYNNADFRILAEQTPNHPGMLLIYLENKPSDMKTGDIVTAIQNVAATYAEGIDGEIVVLNAFHW